MTAQDIQPPARPVRRERPQDWPDRLARIMRARRHREFAWGSHDCALLAAEWVRALRGVDPAKGWRGRYRSALGAQRVLQEAGGLERIVETAVAALGGRELADIRQAGRGDLAVYDTDAGPALGIVLGARVAVPGPKGTVLVRLTACRRAWEI